MRSALHAPSRPEAARLARALAAWKIYYAVLFSELRVERILHMAPQPQDAQPLTGPANGDG